MGTRLIRLRAADMRPDEEATNLEAAVTELLRIVLAMPAIWMMLQRAAALHICSYVAILSVPGSASSRTKLVCDRVTKSLNDCPSVHAIE